MTSKEADNGDNKSDNKEPNSDGCFLHLLLTTDSKQQKALINTISSDQVDLVSELLYNVINVVELSKKQRGVVKTKTKSLKAAANPKLTNKRRKTIIIKHKIQLLKLVKLLKDELIPIAQKYSNSENSLHE